MKQSAILLSALLLVAGACRENDEPPANITWQKLGLDSRTVNEIELSGSALYVATGTGLFRKPLNSDEEFSLLRFENKNVDAIAFVDAMVILASIVDRTGVEPPALYKSTDGGETWALINSNFGGDHPEPVYDFAVHGSDPDILYAAGADVIAKSVDQGLTWEPIYGNWGGLATGISVLEINPDNAEEIWAGGQGAIENGFLLRSVNETDWERWDNLVENPTVAKEIGFVSPGQVLVGWEGALVKTSDGGAHWQTLIDSEQNRFFFGIGIRNDSPARIYTAGWLKTPEPQPLILFISKNGGTTWQEHRLPQETYGGVLEMKIISEESRDVLYLGLDKGGVYQVNVGF